MELVGQTRGPGEPCSDKKCEECIFFERSLTANPCHDCYPSKHRDEWRSKDEQTSDGIEEQMGREDCRTCT